jgi:hypothetical protein
VCPSDLQIAALRMDVQRLTRGKRAAEAQVAELRKELTAAQVTSQPTTSLSVVEFTEFQERTSPRLKPCELFVT